MLSPRPSPRLRLETAEDEGVELGAEELGVLGVGREGAEEAGSRVLLGGLGVLCDVTEGLD